MGRGASANVQLYHLLLFSSNSACHMLLDFPLIFFSGSLVYYDVSFKAASITHSAFSFKLIMTSFSRFLSCLTRLKAVICDQWLTGLFT
ncbi:hypothetical protein GQ43DRAFT_200085 [Delitschia confertaspora ATCC 74209]|uniref:Uncharacterized protein n=1 Tax=Delitschia confertaspora ATCC 74209 TaxID=1513339 RepID=A0A9P4JE45_9PLEO|nr:hypothetical protein GQ43DRAFT_200085 [Delitschia confertaspora ATCC 74209]